MKSIVLAAFCTLTATQVFADMEIKTTEKSVTEAMDALQSAVEGAGATVFARVDHAAGAAKVDMTLPDAQLLIFGNPALGTPPMQADLRAGLVLPLKVFIYDDNGQTTITYAGVDEIFADLNVPMDAEYVGKIAGALDKLTGAAAN